jgi:hypothetical protein
MRTTFPFLKVSACLVLGASAVLGSSSANALTLRTYDLSFTSSGSSSLTGFFTIDVDAAGASMVSWSGIPSWFRALTLTETVSGNPTPYTLADYSAINWDPKTPGSVNFNIDLFDQFADINFFSNTAGVPSGMMPFGLRGSSAFYTMTAATPTAAAVPGPLPILGLPAVLLYSRKLKKRIQARREATNPALV